MQKVTFRSGTPDDAAAIARVLEVFSPVLEATEQPQVQAQQICATAHQWRVGVQNEEIISAVHALPSQMWFGRSRIKWADVGGVSVLASRHGQGIGSLAMSDMVQWLRDNEYGLSRLGGLMRFYSRFGYEPFPRFYIEFPVCEFIRAGASTVPFGESLRPAFSTIGTVRPFNAARDAPQARCLLEKFTRHRTGVRAWEPAGSAADDFRDFLVWESEGKLGGLMRYSEAEADLSPFEASLMIYQLAYDTACPAALDGLIKHVLHRAHEKKATRVTAYLPFTHDVIGHLQQSGVSYTLCETSGAVAGNMVQVGNLRALLEQIQPELQARAASLRWSGSITIDIGSQKAGLEIAAGQIEVGEPRPNAKHLSLSHAGLCRTLLGVLPPVWPDLIETTDEVWPALNILFPPVRGGYNS